jgi:hypothetical protein
MKKMLILAAAAVFAAGVAFAQTTSQVLEAADSYADTTTQTIQVEDKYPELHEKGKNVTLSLEYTPLTGEAIFYYTCTQSSFDDGEAMNVAMAIYDDFAAEHKYKHKKYVAKDKKKYFKNESGIRMVTYSSHVVFTK